MDDPYPVLSRADACAALPRLGGMARPDGVLIASERHWAVARTDGEITEGRMPTPASALNRVPLLRGLVRLLIAFAPLLQGTGVAAPRERLVLATSVVAPLGLAFVPPTLELAAGAALVVALLCWLFRGRTLFLHGAEHRAIEAAERGQLCGCWSGVLRPTRYSRRCGTNLAALALLLSAALYAAVPFARDSLLALPLALGVLATTMEIWFVLQRSAGRLAAALLAPGLALQRLTTREPTLEETRLALRAAASVLARELT